MKNKRHYISLVIFNSSRYCYGVSAEYYSSPYPTQPQGQSLTRVIGPATLR